MKIKFDKLDIGCGNKKPDGYIGIDTSYFEYPEGEFIQADINCPLPFKDNSFVEIRASQIIEHINNAKKIDFINEMHRLLKMGGVFTVEFPPPICKDGLPNPQFFTDPTHTAWWMWGTFFCFDKEWREQDISRVTYENSYHININFKITIFGWIDNFQYHIEMIKL